ncbi:MAG: alpha/beta hydrolase fold domain-containing protein [Vibrio sp.]
MKVLTKIGMLSLISIASAQAADNYTVQKDIPFKTINDKQIGFDLYRPASATDADKPKLLVWVHGGAWKRGSKDELPSKNPLLLKSVLDEGYALAAVDYRLSGEASFPEPVRDINDAINYIYDHAAQYKIDADSIAIMGRSAGGHLAGFIGATNGYGKVDFYQSPKYKVKAVVSFFGPTDLLALGEKSGKGGKKTSAKSSVSRFLGAIPSEAPELAKKASTTSYITKNTPPYIQMHGDIDKRVPVTQSTALKELLDANGVENELYIEKGVGHSDRIFDSEKYVPGVIAFLNQHFPAK